MKNYAVSVITPLHNVPLDVFSRAAQSMRDQTLGFKNVEWVIVLHNNSEEYEQQVQAIFRDDENVKVEVLHNDAHTPSSPRNRGLDIASGEYIGFLDGDDMYTPECLKTALYHMRRTETDVCMFRRAIELESETSLVLNEKVLWDQTQEEIVVNKDTWDAKKLFCSMFVIATHKLYGGKFLRENGLRFDETIEYGEGAEFVLRVFGHVDKVCLLPQLIGYIYFVNSHSIIQSAKNKSDEQLLIYAQGFKKVLDTGLRYGNYMDDVMHLILMLEAGAILSKGKIDEEIRRKIFELMTPYAKMLKPLEPSKLYSPRYLDDLNNLPKYFLSEDYEQSLAGRDMLSYDQRTAPESVQDFQKRTLYHILENGENSDYGLRYHFSDIRTIGGYRSRIQLTDYDMYQPMIRLCTQINETGIFTDEEIIGYTLSFGTVGVPKRLPVTRKHLTPYMREMERMLGGKKVFFMAEAMPYHSPVRNLDTTYTSTLTGILLSEFYNENFRVSLSRKRAEITTPSELLFPDELMDLEYPRLFFALREKDINTIYAPNACVFMNSINRLANDWKRLCDDIETGHISELENFPEEKRRPLNTRIAPDPARAKELRKIFADIKDGNILGHVKDIWPSLVEVIADGSGSYTIYADTIRDNMRHVKYNNDFLASEEAFIAKAVPNTDMYELDLFANFYEFEPMSGGELVIANELVPGSEYRVIVSSCSGLYRYRTSVLVRCEEVSERSVTVKRLCPRDYDIDAMEGITEETVYRAVQLFERKSDVQIADFVLVYDDDKECYNFILEPVEFGGNCAKASGMSQSLMDEITKECRELLGTSRPLTLSFSAPGTHALYSEMTQYRRKVTQDAVRPCHVIDSALGGKFFLKLTGIK